MVARLMNIVSTVDVDVEHHLLSRQSSFVKPGPLGLYISLDLLSAKALCLCVSAFVSLSMCLCIFAFLSLCICLSIDQFAWASFMRPSRLPQSHVFLNCYGVRTYAKDIMTLNIFTYVFDLLMNQSPQIFSSYLDAIAPGLCHGLGMKCAHLGYCLSVSPPVGHRAQF